MSLNPRVCKKSYKVHIPMMGEACEFWLITVTDEQSITNPDKDHAYLADDGKLFVFNGDSLVRVNCDICFTQEEREKLEGIEEGANKYVLPVASSTELGGVLLGYTQNGRNYPITKDTKGNIYVNVPWEEYQLPKATDNALGGIKTGYKQNGKFYPIKTDTDGNAYVQVPWEDTNTVYEVVSKTSNGLMPMLPSDENASKRFLNGDGEWVVGADNSINGITQTGSTFSGETSDCGVEILEVQGKTVQQTTNGYQLFDASKFPTKSQGGATVTNNGDGSFTISGAGNLTENFNNAYIYSNEQFKKFIKKGQLKLNVGSSNPKVSITFYDDSLSPLKVYVDLEDGRNSGTITDEILNNSNMKMRIRFYGLPNYAIETATVKPMLYQDGDGTWEQYTGGKPAPNPDYPMPIENVEISKINSFNKNLSPKNTIEDITWAINDNQLVERVNKLPIGKYYVSMKFTLTEKTEDFSIEDDLYGILFSSNGYQGKQIRRGTDVIGTIKELEFALEITSDNVGRFINVWLYGAGSTGKPRSGKAKITELQIEKGGTKTEFVESKSATVETSLKIAQDDIYQQGHITRARKQVTFDGSSDEAWAASSSPNTFYVTLSDKSTATSNEMLSNRFVGIERTTPVASLESGQMKEDENNPKIVYFKVAGITSVSDFKTWLSTHNTVVEYKLATPTTEEFKVPTIPSYEPYTEISTNSVVDPTITFRPFPFTTCLVGEATEEESGYMPPLSGNSNEFLNGSGEWSVPSGYTLPTASSSTLGGVKIGENITISSGTISIDKEDVTGALGYTPPTTNTTYSVATTSKDGLMSSTDKAKLTNLRRIWKGTSSSPPSGWVDGDIYVQYEE